MTMRYLTAIVLLVLMPDPLDCSAQKVVLSGPYFGQIKPGNEAEIFAPGMVSCQGSDEYDLHFSRNANEFNFLSRSKQGVIDTLFCIQAEGVWKGPAKLHLAERPWIKRKITVPLGDHAYLERRKRFVLFDRTGENGKRDLYIAIREKGDAWSEAFPLGDKVNTSWSETHPTLSPRGKYLFFSRWNEINEMADIYWIKADFIYDMYRAHKRK